MAVSFSLRQITSIETGPLYRVNNTVEAATDAPLQVFVFKTTTQKFDHYATVADLETYPDNYADAVAGNVPFYRLATVTRDWGTVQEMEDDVQMTKDRLTLLAEALKDLQAGVPSNTLTVIEPE